MSLNAALMMCSPEWESNEHTNEKVIQKSEEVGEVFEKTISI